MPGTRALRNLAGAAAVLLVVAGCASARDLATSAEPDSSATPSAQPKDQPKDEPKDEPSASPSAGPPTDKPTVGECRATPDNLLDQSTDPTEPVGCDQRHTLETFAVVEGTAPLDEEQVQQLLGECQQALDGYLGGPSQGTTRVSWFYFEPASEQAEAGSAWLRCDVGLSTTTAAGPLEPVTQSAKGALADGIPGSYRRCLDGPADTGQAQPLVPCTEPHAAEMIPELRPLGDADDDYPGQQKLVDAHLPWCQALTDRIDGADTSQLEVPTEQAWQSGARTATCWAVAADGKTLPPVGTST
ncbi:MAG: hypothetical protein GEU96_11795 [Propionibacteriales bacterium]|nr:hypothetical protein [Propionibacteriales bacterium]